jgi:hypothetical protein
MSRGFEPVSLVAGLAMSSVGLLLLLDNGGSVDLTGGWLAAVICAAVGAILVVSGLASRAP